MKVIICFPHHGDVKAKFTLSLLANVVKIRTDAPTVELGTAAVNSSDLADARNQIVRTALDAGADWLFMVDTDQVFPGDTLARLLSHGKPLVACNYKRRTNGVPIAEPKQGLEQVPYLGLGVCLAHRNVFETVTEPWFAFADGKAEDYYFFDKARAAGISLYCDHDLSRQVGHVAEQVLTL